jgi:two-component system sensor histidine kinase RegB
MMDAPLLALTRRRDTAGEGPSSETAATDNMRQLMQLRWIAVAGQLVTILIVHFGLGVPLPLPLMLGVVALLALANLVAGALLPRRRVANAEILLALLFDVSALTVQLYLGGGAANPFISLYLLQVVLGAILLDRWSAWVLVGVTCLCYAGLTAYSRPLIYPSSLAPHVVSLYTVGAGISFALICVLLAQFITRITRNLRARDERLADLRRQSVEEDGIVRMGLFASGAAHELGTPLASLSVILNDWRRMPRFADDAELTGELDEMQAEVQRCKLIVGDILHAAGEPRGEAMDSAAAAAFLSDVVDAWRQAHPLVPFDYNHVHLDGVTVPASPALRQAIASLLDNAAEASPAGLSLHASSGPEGLLVSIADHGPGFVASQLAAVGKPYQSNKGPGHGLGLFLAANLARRLGGRLEAGNRPGGGAEIKLILPFASKRSEQS